MSFEVNEDDKFDHISDLFSVQEDVNWHARGNNVNYYTDCKKNFFIGMHNICLLDM